MPVDKRPLKVFLCHAHSDKDAVRELYARLRDDGVDVWLDKENLLPGQNWRAEIRAAVEKADAVIVCHSQEFNKEGFRQREVKWALDAAMEKLEGEIFIIPARLEECEVIKSLSDWHWVDLFDENGYRMLLRALQERANNIGAILQIKKGWLPSVTLPRKEKPPAKKKPESADNGGVGVGGDVSGAVIVTGDNNIIHMGQAETPGSSVEKARLEEERRKRAEEQAEREATEKAARENAEKEAAEQVRLQAEEEERRRIEKEKVEREAAEKAAREKAEREAADRIAREKAEREAAEKSAREKTKSESAEKARQEKRERLETRRAALARTSFKFFTTLKTNFTQIKPFLRIAGLTGTVIVLIWGSSWAIPKFVSLIPTAKPSATITRTVTPIPSTTTPIPTTTKTKVPTVTPRPSTFSIYDNFSSGSSSKKFDPALWIDSGGEATINWQSGYLVFSGTNGGHELRPRMPQEWQIGQIGKLQADLRIDEVSGGYAFSKIGIDTTLSDGKGVWWVQCRAGSFDGKNAQVICDSYRAKDTMELKYQTNSYSIEFGKFYTVAIEVASDASYVRYYVDGEKIGGFQPEEKNLLLKSSFGWSIGLWMDSGVTATGAVDSVMIGK
ncbi:MAG: TIR domain-containing protein [Anaerolineales bacterium]|nr:TIR domain-containing protein [Anaerolineales bacterium]